jgi:hypothetical protein
MLAVAVGLAAADSLNPTTIGQTTVFAVGRRPLRTVSLFWAGAFLCYVVLRALLVLGPGQLLAGAFRDPSPGLRALELALGCAALIGGVVVWRRRHTLRLGMRLMEGDPSLARRIWVVGTLTDLPTAFPYYGIVAFLSASGLVPEAARGAPHLDLSLPAPGTRRARRAGCGRARRRAAARNGPSSSAGRRRRLSCSPRGTRALRPCARDARTRLTLRRAALRAQGARGTWRRQPARGAASSHARSAACQAPGRSPSA